MARSSVACAPRPTASPRCARCDRRSRAGHRVLLRFGTSLHDDAEGLGVLEAAPERELRVALEQVGRQDGLARAGLHLRVHPVQPVEAELGVELRRIVFDLREIVLERLLAKKLVDEREHLRRPLGEDGYTYKRQLEGFADAILHGKKTTGGTIDDGVAAIRAMVAIARSVERGDAVGLSDVNGSV